MNATTIVDYDPGDTLGKILSFINQVRMSSEGVRKYLARACTLHNMKPLELRLWVRTQWGSLSNCLESVLVVQKAINYFCLTADANEDLAPLKNKSWSDYHLTTAEWKLIKLVHHCLKVVAARHNELLNEELVTCSRVLPMMELLMSEWEDLKDDIEYELVHKALRAGIDLLEKYYCHADDTDAYFISHILDPILKCEYVNAVWEDKYVDIGMEQFKAQFLIYKKKYEASQKKDSTSLPSTAPSSSALLSTDAWMESLIKKKKQKKGKDRDSELVTQDTNPFEELHCYLKQPRLRREECTNPIPWWGHQFEYPVLCSMARDYLAIPATTCIAERSFSLSAWTDDPRRRQMKKLKFGGLQKLRAGYMDGRLSVEGEIMKKYIADFMFDNEDYID
ncbi:hypothetical protein M378DRAFT_8428 [Amanita muscaria Koide BX008]|uniref:HAT C-terminal dimerisation domain-containing protein n=1 Tax=Amanita muscaria (strain Koide BX008) TaxID=946122 RepID=A0A0C2TP89_AMAMK|nr:hypothetical protein M378DRAFT_8428 [Amanita muscaria Koide BX008]